MRKEVIIVRLFWISQKEYNSLRKFKLKQKTLTSKWKTSFINRRNNRIEIGLPNCLPRQ